MRCLLATGWMCPSLSQWACSPGQLTVWKLTLCRAGEHAWDRSSIMCLRSQSLVQPSLQWGGYTGAEIQAGSLAATLEAAYCTDRRREIMEPRSWSSTSQALGALGAPAEMKLVFSAGVSPLQHPWRLGAALWEKKGHPVHHRMLSSILGVHPPLAALPSVDNQKELQCYCGKFAWLLLKVLLQ